MPSGGKRIGAGRKSQGITKKVSLTLTADEWNQIESSGLTVAAFLQQLMNEPKPKILTAKDSLIEILNKKILNRDDLLLVLKYYSSQNNTKNDLFGSCGVDSNGYAYEYKFSYKKDDEEIFKFWSDHRL